MSDGGEGLKVVPVETSARNEVVRKLEHELERARRGEIRSIAYVTRDIDGHSHDFSIENVTDAFTLLGALDFLKMRITTYVLTEGEE